MLQTAAKDGLRGRSDFVFAASTVWLGPKFASVSESYGLVSSFTYISINLHSCGVAIIAEVKHKHFTSFVPYRKESMELACLLANLGTHIDYS